MEENKYRLAGWLSIAAAVLFPVAFTLGIIQTVIGAAKFHYTGPNFGPSDLVFIMFTLILIYALLRFRALLNEYYDFKEIDILITISIWWNVFFQLGSLAINIFLFIIWPVEDTLVALIFLPYFVAFLLTGGIIDIFIAYRILREKDRFPEIIRVFGYVTMVSGCSMATLIFSPITLLLTPVIMIIMSMIFFKERDAVEFV